MASPMFDQWSQTHKISLAPILELSNITTRLCGTICRQNLDALNRLAQNGQEQLQGLSQAKGLEGLMQTQAKLVASTTPLMFQHAEELLNTFIDSATEYQTWLESSIQSMNQQNRNFAEKK